MAGDATKPDFKIKVDGSPIADKLVSAVIHVTVDDALDAAAVATIKLRDKASEVSNDHPFKVGAAIEICLGYVSNCTTVVFKGEVTGHQGSFVRRGNQTLVVICHDKFHRLRRNRRSASHLKVKDSDVITKAAQAAGLSADVKASPFTQEIIHQLNQTDADFVLERAAQIGREVYVDDAKLVCREPDLKGSKVTTLEWHMQLRHFQVAIDVSRQTKEAKVQAWDMVQKKRIEASAKKGKERDLMGGTEPGSDAIKDIDGTQPRTKVGVPARSQEEVQAYVDTQFRVDSEQFLRGEGACEGDPKIRRGTVVELEGIGNYLSGPYYVRRAIHTLLVGSGYTTTFYALRTAVQRPGQAPKLEMPAPAEQEPFEAEPDNDPLSFQVSDPVGAPLGGMPFVIVDPSGKRQGGQLGSDGKVDVQFEEGGG
ncbi:MAG: phage late control D family protein [Planctomycetota bacterium]